MNKADYKSKAQPTLPDTEPWVRRMCSQELFGDHKEMMIEHAGQEYRLRITRQNKLILTK